MVFIPLKKKSDGLHEVNFSIDIFFWVYETRLDVFMYWILLSLRLGQCLNPKVGKIENLIEIPPTGSKLFGCVI